MLDNNLIAIILPILVIVLFITVVFLIYIFFSNRKSIANLNSKVNNRVTKLISDINTKLKNIDTKLATIPNVQIEVKNSANAVIQNELTKIETHIQNSFSKVGQDILYEQQIDEYCSKTISLKEILKNSNDNYTAFLKNLMSGLENSNILAKSYEDKVLKYKKEINAELETLTKNVSVYLKAQAKAKEFSNRLTTIEYILEINSGKSGSGGKKSTSKSGVDDSDTLDDYEFEIDTKDIDIKNLSLTNDSPEKEDYKRYLSEPTTKPISKIKGP